VQSINSLLQGDLGHTDLQEDLEFHSSNFATDATPSNRKAPPGSSGLPPPATSSGGSSKRFLWTLSFYAQFFDVDTSSVLSRCWAALFPRANFLDVLEGNPDLYGPFWIATTVVFILFLGGTISQYWATSKEEAFVYDFRLLSGMLFLAARLVEDEEAEQPCNERCWWNQWLIYGTGAAGLIYGYTLVIPIALFLALKYFGSESANLLECWALYGYSNLIWIPVALISSSHMTALNYVFVALGFGLSITFLLRNLYPVLAATDKQISKVLLILVVVLHAGLAIAIKVLFFSYGNPVAKVPAGDAGDAGDAAGRL
jgi:hypothetical protein